ATGGTAPTYDIELWEMGGGSRIAILAGAVSLPSDTPTVVSATWDASSLTTADGSKVELKIIGHTAGNGGSKRTVEVGAVEWNAAAASTASGLYYLRARYYDQAIGRFMARDRLYGDAAAPTSQNRFTYVTSNPATLVDPSGFVPNPTHAPSL